MTGRISARTGESRIVAIRTEGGCVHQPVIVATSADLRRRGLRPWALGWGLLLAGRSVHAFGMVENLLIVGLDRDGRVTGVQRLRSGRALRLRRADYVLELPGSSVAPEAGEHLFLLPILGP